MYTSIMTFEWDENKNQTNIRKHGISFEQAKIIFDHDILTRIDNRYNYGEIREISLGQIDGEVIVVVVHTKRNNNIRIMSPRKANKTEIEVYNEYTRKNNRHHVLF